MEELGRLEERVILIGVQTAAEDNVLDSLDELEELAETAGAVTVGRIIQNREAVHPGTYIGKGKIEEVRSLVYAMDATGVICDDELSPAQLNNLERELDCKVMDRTLLILDIFAARAVTSEGKIQVELAQLQYTAPRLTGRGTDMSRLGGGIGTRGPGESKLESDRRHMKRRVDALKAELAVVEKNRRTMRQSRDRSGLPRIAIVGYTNAGKSTLLNTLTGAGILAEDKLFATLDPTTRKFTLPGGESVLLTDTVGFIRKLPHHLISAFRSTLEEAVYADIILLLLDVSDPHCEEQLRVTEELLTELGAGAKPTLYVFNKCDREAGDRAGLERMVSDRFRDSDARRALCISARTGEGCDALATALETLIRQGKRRVTFRIPNAQSGALARLYSEKAAVESVEYGDEYITAVATVDDRVYGLLKQFDPNRRTPEGE